MTDPFASSARASADGRVASTHHKLAVTTTDKLFIYSIPAPSEKSESKPVQLERLKAISRDAVTIQSKLSFRAARSVPFPHLSFDLCGY